MQRTLLPADARKVCTPDFFDSLPQLPDGESNVIVGQERAIKALKLGLGIKAPGFNLYVCGDPGTGKLSAITSFVEKQARNEPVPCDWCYVNNFKDTYCPSRLSMPAGSAAAFKKEMKALIRDLFNALVKAFESEEYANRKEKIINSFVDVQNRILGEVNELAQRDSFMLKQTPTTIITVPVKNNTPLTEEELANLTPAEVQDLNARQAHLQEALNAALREIRKGEKATDENLESMSREVAQYAIGSLIDELHEKYEAMPQVKAYLDSLRDDIMENLADFMKSQKPGPNNGGMENPFLRRYEVTVLVDNGGTRGAPVIIERNPSYNNLLGRVDKESYMGTLITDFTMIRKGAVHSANGGYLIIRIEELLKNMFSWECLKRILKNKEIVIEEAADQLGYLTTRMLKPEPIPLDVKVILIGNPHYYQLIYQLDPDFMELFKVKADFDNVMPRNDAGIASYSAFVRSLCEKEKLMRVDNTALAKLVEHSSRLAEHQDKLSARFGAIADIVREAGYYATADEQAAINGTYVCRAIEEKYYRSNLIQEKINEMITAGQVFIDTTKEQTGQINGLSVLGLGDISFGIPVRITCTVGPGHEGVIAIEREAELSGPTHTKGVLILSGYLSGKFMQERAANLSARLVFEQSYSHIDGDSASSTELYAILSALSGLPVKQGIAVTGSVNQKGEIQPIGGVNEKIEGYYEICRHKGLDGSQGVMIPASNMQNLMLKEEIVDAIASGAFRLYAVDTIEDGIELLTGIKAGSAAEEGTVFHKVGQTLKAFEKALDKNGEEEKKDEEKKKRRKK